MALMEQRGSPHRCLNGWGWRCYYDVNDSTLRKEAVRRLIWLEAFIFLRLPGALGACCSCLGLNVFLCAIRHEKVQGGVRGKIVRHPSSKLMKSQSKEFKEIVRLLQFC